MAPKSAVWRMRKPERGKKRKNITKTTLINLFLIFGWIRVFWRYNIFCLSAFCVGRRKKQENKDMSVVSPQVPARLRRAFGRFVGPAGAALFSLVLASCAGGGFGGAGDASDISGVNPVSQPAPAASGPISPASQRKVAEAVSGLDLGEETPPISPEDIAVSNDSGILDSNPFSSSGACGAVIGLGSAGGFHAEDAGLQGV